MEARTTRERVIGCIHYLYDDDEQAPTVQGGTHVNDLDLALEDKVDLLLCLEHEFAVHLPSGSEERFGTVDEIVELIRELKSKK